MPKPYPDPNITTSEGLLEYVYEITNGLVTILFVSVAAIVIFILLYNKGYKPSSCMVLSGIFSLILSSFLWIMGVLQGRFVVLFLALTLASSIWNIFDR